MRFFNYLVFSFFLIANAHAQQNHFIYIQTENKQVFYIRLNDKIFSSAASGYLVIPKLAAGNYKLNIGFPKNEWPLQSIDVTINNKDEGYLLKNFNEKGWGLFNLQTLDVIMGSAVNTTATPATVNKTDAFSNTLAEVTNTPSIRQQDPVKDVSTAVPTDTMKPVSREEVKKEDMAVAVTTKTISKVFSVIDTSGRSIIYAVNDGSKADSIRIFIPYDKKEIKEPVKDTIATEKAIVKEEKAIVKDDQNILSASVPDSTIKKDSVETIRKDSVEIKKDSIVNNPPTVITETQKPVEDKAIITDVKVSDGNAGSKVTLLNPGCKSIADNDDFLKLRKKMAATENDEDMIAAAKKGFKSKCFTTDQVKNLSLLFLKDDGKYNFYDAAYSHVSDIGNFKDLQSQLTDEYYITRFKAMLR